MVYKIEEINKKIKEYKDYIKPIKINNIQIKYGENFNQRGYLYEKKEEYAETSIELFIDDTLCMEISPREMQGAFQIIKNARGKVGIVGLGLGYLTNEILNKESVNQVIVYESNKDIIDLYYKNFGENTKLTILNEDAFNAKGEEFTCFIVDIYNYSIKDEVVSDYKKLNEIHKIEEYYFFGFEHFLLSCPTAEIAFVFIPEYWTSALESVYRQLMDNKYINDFIPLDEDEVTRILLKFKEIL